MAVRLKITLSARIAPQKSNKGGNYFKQRKQRKIRVSEISASIIEISKYLIYSLLFFWELPGFVWVNLEN